MASTGAGESAVTADEWQRVRQIFEAAVERDPAERARYLDEVCGGDPMLKAEVTSLLTAHETADQFIEAPAYEAAADLLLDSPSDQLAGRMLGPYLVRQEIGRGGMGVVYLADDTRLARRVALKAIAAAAGAGSRGRERLQQEARAAAQLSHPGIATVYALEEIDQHLYITSEYVPGPTLRAVIAKGPLPFSQVIDIAAQLADALAAAHAQGIVHGDLKPENVVRTSAGVVKVLDFGLARFEQHLSNSPTASETAAGTPAYMAPEEIRGEDVDFRADLFALGIIVHELATGSNPFHANSTAATLAKTLEMTPAPLSSVTSPAFAPLDRIVATCLAKDPQQRYGSTRKLAADFERLRVQTEASEHLQARRVDHRQVARTPKWWWEFHQAVISVMYFLMLYPAWRARAWLPPPWATAFLWSVLASAAAAITLRLHLWFTARFFPDELSTQLARSQSWTRWGDAAFSASLVGAALGIGAAHPEIATLFISVSTAAVIASFMIEPTTTRAAFRDRS
jgi:predicted Ser/Thr protein kinase